jgi:hypothetical protein
MNYEQRPKRSIKAGPKMPLMYIPNAFPRLQLKQSTVYLTSVTEFLKMIYNQASFNSK